MSPRDPILSALQQWRELTETESLAIVRSDWSRVADCHEEKKRLQDIIARALQPDSDGAGPRSGPKTWPEDIRILAGDLIAMENRNAKLLARKRKAALAARADLERSGINLRRIRGSYGGTERARRRFELTV